MNHLSLRTLLICIVLPAVCYVLSLHALEEVIQRKWTAELRGVLIPDSRSLLQGHISIEDEIQRNIDSYLASRSTLRWGVVPRIVVKTETGRRLYPSSGQEPFYAYDSDMLPLRKAVPAPTQMLDVAKSNLKIMDEGIELTVSVDIPGRSWLANGVLAFYILIFALVLYRVYRLSTSEAERRNLRSRRALEAANHKLTMAEKRLHGVTDRERTYRREIESLKAELALASDAVRTTEGEALAEIEALETSLHESVALRKELEKGVSYLQHELKRIESSRKTPTKKQHKQINTSIKRFKTLYKNLEFHPRAVEGFLNLTNDLQLRAEEFIHKTNENSTRLSAKRKVFSRKGTVPVFECEFAYRGRIYWKPGRGGKTQILVIGTKQTQNKDLAYLEGL